MSNRFDNRTKEAFKKQIKEYHKQEAEIALRLCIAVHHKSGVWPELRGDGVDCSGKFIEQDANITCKPDYKIGDRSVEITCSKVICAKIFHEKCNKVEKMLRDNTDMVFVNGLLESKQPNYIWLSGIEWEPFIERSKSKYGIVNMLGGGRTGFLNKSAYRFDIYWFDEANLFRPLPVLKGVKLPEMYKEIITIAKV